MAQGESKVKCKYWENCYRKDAAHLQNYLHPKQDDAEDKTKTKTSTDHQAFLDLRGKKVVFTGALRQGTRTKAEVEAQKYGCITPSMVSSKTDIVVVGADAGQKADKAKELGIQIVDEEDWLEMLKQAKQVSEKRKADDDDSGSSPAKKAKTSVKKGGHDKHSISDSEDEDSPAAGGAGNKIETKKRKVNHDLSDISDDDEPKVKKAKPATPSRSPSPAPYSRSPSPAPSSRSPSPAPRRQKPKCLYWEKCYRKDETHLKTYRHPKDEDTAKSSDAEEISGGGSPKPENVMQDGDTVDVDGGLQTYRIKRTGDHYYCTCIGWKTQNKPIDGRTCKHLKQHLGEKYEAWRCGDSSTAGPKGGTKTISRNPRHKAFASLLLAHKWTEATDPKGWQMSEKLDGVRAYWDGEGFYSRLGNEFIPPPWFTKGFPKDMTLDGELFGGRGKFQSTVSIVKTAGSDRWKEIKYYIFDCPSHRGGFEQRLAAVRKYFEENKLATVVVLDHEMCKGAAHIKEELKKVIEKGGEGLMIRKPKSPYVNGRSNTLLKIKMFHDAEARVIGHDPGKGRHQGSVGALRCEMACGIKFSVGSGLSDRDRANPPKKGSIITYKFQELTDSGVPRFPTFLGVRIDMDEPKDAVLPAKKKDD